jgi:glycosyltransferase involved in cell wall biosynthesis
MRIGFILYADPEERFGGAEYQAVRLARKLADAGHRVTIFAGSRRDSVDREGPGFEKIRIRYWDVKFFRIFASQLAAFLPVIRGKASELDVLVAFSVNPAGIVGLAAKRLFRLPLVTWIRGGYEYTSLLAGRVFLPLLLRASDRVIVQSPGIRDQVMRRYSRRPFLRKVDYDKITVIPNGVELGGTVPPAEERRSGLLYVGRLHRVKGLEFLFDAMNGLENNTLHVIGDGPLRESLEARVNGRDIRFMGRLSQDEVRQVMAESRVLILPSLSEALPNVLLEAMSVGLPAVVTRVGGIPDLVEDGESGLLVEPGNADQIRSAVRRLESDRVLWRRISRNSQEKVQAFSWDSVLAALQRELSELAA